MKAKDRKLMVGRQKEIRDIFFSVMADKYDIEYKRDRIRLKEPDIFHNTGLTELDLIDILDSSAEILSEKHGKEVGLTDNEVFDKISVNDTFFDSFNWVANKYYEQIFS